MPGPAVIIAARYQASPVGPYSELLVAEPARVGLRPGWCVTNGVVDSSAARVGARLNWGFPKELGSLVWEFEGNERELRWVERGIAVRGRPGSAVFPLLLPFRNLQRRADGPVASGARPTSGGSRSTSARTTPSSGWPGPTGARWCPACTTCSTRPAFRPAWPRPFAPP